MESFSLVTYMQTAKYQHLVRILNTHLRHINIHNMQETNLGKKYLQATAILRQSIMLQKVELCK